LKECAAAGVQFHSSYILENFDIKSFDLESFDLKSLDLKSFDLQGFDIESFDLLYNYDGSIMVHSHDNQTQHAGLSWFHGASHLSRVPWIEVEGHHSPPQVLANWNGTKTLQNICLT